MAITPKLMTADELFRLPDDHMRHELVRGELRTLPLRTLEQAVPSSNALHSLYDYAEAYHLGAVVGGVGFILETDPDTVRAADVVFVRQDRVPRGDAAIGYVHGAPDLAVEVVSRDDLYLDVHDKIAEWLEHGTRLVFVVNPRRRTVAVHRPGQPVTVLGIDDVLSGEDVVPGWRLAVRDLFDQE